MASSNIKRLVNNAIADYFASNIPGLAGKVFAVQEGPEKISDFPSVAMLPAVFTFDPSDPDFVNGDDDSTDPLIVDVGEFNGMAELQLYTKSMTERELYEQRILDLFLNQQDSPGTIYVQLPNLPVGGFSTLYAPQLKIRLDDAEWMEEFSFESRRYSFLDFTYAFPALVTRDVPSINQLVLALQEEAQELDDREEITVNDDGSVS